MKCVCDLPRAFTARRGGVPVALWSCSTHGNVFDEADGEPLTSIQKIVLEAVAKARRLGHAITADSISRETDMIVATVERALLALQSRDLIPAPPKDGTT